MRTILLAAGVAAFALATPAIGQGQGKGGPPGGGGPQGKGGGPGGGPGRGGGPDRGPAGGGPKGGPERGGPDRGGPGRGPDREARGPDRDGPRGGPERGRGGPDRGPGFADKGDGKGGGRDRGKGAWQGDEPGRGVWKGERADWKGDGPGARGKGEWKDAGREGPAWDARAPAARFASRRWDGDGYRWDGRDYAIPVSDGCPPGLVQRGEGCVPRGSLRRLGAPTGWGDWYPAQYQRDDYDWAYGDGYLYRYDQGGGGLGGLIGAFVPLLGGALFGGNAWPQQYGDYQVPDYYDRFYGSGYNGDYDYRYADDAIFAVDAGSGRIDSIAGLLTGDQWAVGQRMPVGYDLYNVPPQYRDRYADDADHLYRYSDGYVYDVDPGSQLVRAVSELLG